MAIESITPVETNKLQQAQQVVVVDVREEDEIMSGMVPHALWMPTSEIGSPKWSEFLGKLPKDKTIVLYCRSGRRSEGVAVELQGLGYRVKNLGGFSSWEQAGLPTQVPS